MALQKIEKQGIGDAVYRQLFNAIADGVWKPKEKIPPENELAGELGVSRVTVRSALQRLEGLKLIERRQGEGTYVREITGEQYADSLLPIVALGEHDLADLMEFRELFDGEVAYLAAKRAEKEDVAAIREVYEKHCKAAGEGDFKAAAEYDTEFHLLLAVASHNPLIKEIYENFRPVFGRNMYEIVSKMGTDDGKIYHSLILEAVGKHDENRARELMREHVRRTVEAMKK